MVGGIELGSIVMNSIGDVLDITTALNFVAVCLTAITNEPD